MSKPVTPWRSIRYRNELTRELIPCTANELAQLHRTFHQTTRDPRGATACDDTNTPLLWSDVDWSDAALVKYRAHTPSTCRTTPEKKRGSVKFALRIDRRVWAKFVARCGSKRGATHSRIREFILAEVSR